MDDRAPSPATIAKATDALQAARVRIAHDLERVIRSQSTDGTERGLSAAGKVDASILQALLNKLDDALDALRGRA